MKSEKKYITGSALVMSRYIPDSFTRSHPLLIWMLYLPVVLFLLHYSFNHLLISALAVLTVYLPGLVLWTWFEYKVHRYLHKESDNASSRAVFYRIHGFHHDFPTDKYRLFIHPVPGLLVAGMIFVLLYFIVKQHAFLFTAGFMSGYMLHASLHYALHFMAPPFSWMKKLWASHHKHHYEDDHLGFGVTTTFWDRIYGTLHKEETDKIRHQANVRYFGFKRPASPFVTVKRSRA